MIIKFKNKEFRLSDWIVDNSEHYDLSGYARYAIDDSFRFSNDSCFIDLLWKRPRIYFTGEFFPLNDIYFQMFGKNIIQYSNHNELKSHIDDFLSNKLKLLAFL